jgi:hypothetical protein
MAHHILLNIKSSLKKFALRAADCGATAQPLQRKDGGAWAKKGGALAASSGPGF